MNKKSKNQLRFRKTSSLTPYFEGFYFKFISKEKKMLIIIVGISISESTEYAFIQIASNIETNNKLYKFPITDLVNSGNSDGFSIKKNHFSQNKVYLELGNTIVDLAFHNRNDWKRGYFNPNIMGILSYMPKVECKHDILTINAKTSGKIQINNEKYKFKDGKSYIEKNWGQSFPRKYLWVHANQFKDNNISLQFAIANPKWFNFSPKVYIGYIMLDKIIHIRSHRLSMVSISKTENSINIQIKKANKIIHINIKTLNPVKLLSPENGEIKNIITEYMNSEVELIILKRNIFKDNNVLLRDTSKLSTAEIQNYI